VTGAPIVAAVVCPHPPLLLPTFAAGAAGILDALVGACDAAVRHGLGVGVERVVVVGAGERTARWSLSGIGAAHAFGAPQQAGAAAPPLPFAGALSPPRPPVLPLSLTVARELLRRAGWDGPTAAVSVDLDASVADCAKLGAEENAGPPGLLLVLGDGAAVGRNAPPGAAKPGAEPFDDAVWAALAAADADALLAIEPSAAAGLLAQGRAAWQVLAGAVHAAGGRWRATGLHRESPYGVGYFVASWIRQ
jgi:hypothetical protein